MRKHSWILLLTIGLLTLSPLASAAPVKDDWGMWLSNTYQTDFGGSNYLAFLELAPRTKNDNGEFNQVIVRPLLGYKLTRKLQLWLGYTWQGEYSKETDFELATNDFMQQLQWIDDWTPQLNFQYRFRMEERFFEGENTAFRMRHRFRFTYTLPETKAYLIALDELFVYFNSINHGRLASSVQPGINQNRSYVGVGYKLTPKINIDTGYQFQYVNNFGAQGGANHIWLTNLNVNF
ncbi:DUF2490 domain-containing protein [Methylomicrobium album]|uniref:DUF2490 domain-containing protein n=1 Tax=Methylomicrobium album BG8 TaxID=686340 RepID=H8GR86_METAL|nr:DUF2490 domain-containing protein [Methylomicrobium album]EIC29913.1 Protein of unknown function (DUF2490) [Methylomicrobium album BG8]